MYEVYLPTGMWAIRGVESIRPKSQTCVQAHARPAMTSDFDVKRDVRLQERLAKDIASLVKQPDNASCADCGATRTVRFVSVTIGTFICNRCYGIHRSIGAHITRGKCIGVDLWLPAEVCARGLESSGVQWGARGVCAMGGECSVPGV